MNDPTDIAGEVTERVSLDISPDDWAFLKQMAKYRNALATASGKNLKTKWSRKSLAESFIADQCAAARHQLRAMFDAVGGFPAADDAKAMAKYAAAVIAWDKKHK